VNVSPRIEGAAGGGNVSEHIAQVSRNRDFLDRVLDSPVFDQESTGAT
jgi:hypothetical protein